MLNPRVIPCLLLDGEGLVKTERFARPKYVGDPINAIRIFNEKEVDELMLLDIGASRRGRGPNFALIEQVAGECFMPLCYGGGIRDAADARQLLAAGVEKVALQSAFFERPEVVREIADHAGSQAVVVSIDVEDDRRGQRRLRRPGRGTSPFASWEEAVTQAAALGAGEIMLTNADRDGTLGGLDLDLIREGSALVEVPLIAAGGANSLENIGAAVSAGASAVAAGAFFVFYGPHRAVLITYPRYEELRALWQAAA
jgi:cyclase